MDIGKLAPTVQNSGETKTTLSYRMGQWLQDPLGSIVIASAATIGSFGIVLSGMWLISLAVA